MPSTYISELCAAIEAVDPALRSAAQNHLDNLTKPRGSLGRLEETAARLFCIGKGSSAPLRVDPAVLYTVAGDHGVAEENVSPYPQDVTRQMVLNFLNGGAAINVLCRTFSLDLQVVDAGCKGGPFAPHPLLVSRRLGEGTANLAKGPAMSVETCLTAIENGVNIAGEAARKYRCIGTGEMGIANTTPATALFCALYGLKPEAIAGPGAGSSPEGVRHKAQVVNEALELHKDVIASKDYVGILAAVGGFEIATIAGIMLGAAKCGLPFLVDGFICTSAFAVASAICPQSADYAFLSHASAEPGFAPVLKKLNVPAPLLNLGMRLGEGTGAAAATALLRASANIFNEMATFSSANIADRQS